MWRPQVWLLVLLLAVGVALGIKTDCPKPCIPLDQCPELAKSVLKNAAVVQEAVCEISVIGPPKVCCPTPISSNPLLPESCGHSLDRRIIGGTTTMLGKYPWMVALGYESSSATKKITFGCGGSVISEQYILTAAHCLDRDVVVVRLGDWNLASDTDCQAGPSGTMLCNDDRALDLEYEHIEEIIIHPGYEKGDFSSDDIALIRLARPITFSQYVKPVCLPERNLNVNAAMSGREAVVIGWGHTERGVGSDKLLEVSLPQVESAACNETYRGFLAAKQICFGGVPGQDSCQGDSGGPLMMSDADFSTYTQIGIVSFGIGCGLRGIPGVYVSVASYRDWIDQKMRPQDLVQVDPNQPPTTTHRPEPPLPQGGPRCPPIITHREGPPLSQEDLNHLLTTTHRQGPPLSQGDPGCPQNTIVHRQGPPLTQVDPNNPPTTTHRQGPPLSQVDPRCPPSTITHRQGPPLSQVDPRCNLPTIVHRQGPPLPEGDPNTHRQGPPLPEGDPKCPPITIVHRAGPPLPQGDPNTHRQGPPLPQGDPRCPQNTIVHRAGPPLPQGNPNNPQRTGPPLPQVDLNCLLTTAIHRQGPALSQVDPRCDLPTMIHRP